MHYQPRKVDTDKFVDFLARLRMLSTFVQPADFNLLGGGPTKNSKLEIW